MVQTERLSRNSFGSGVEGYLTPKAEERAGWHDDCEWLGPVPCSNMETIKNQSGVPLMNEFGISILQHK